MSVKPRKVWRDAAEKRALQLLAGAPHGFTVRQLARIVRAGFATANPEIVKAGGRTLSLLRLAITDLGRQALGDDE
jgi:hypothetical protein